MLRQTGKSWVSSPLGRNLLLAMFKNETQCTKEYIQIKKALKNKMQYKSENKVLYSDPNLLKDKFKHLEDAIKINYQDNEKIKEINSWVADNFNLKDSNINYFKPETKLILNNISSYEDKWYKSDNKTGAIMKVYNSFNYTDDIKYEARLLEFPMQDDFKLAIIVPNEVDVLSNLFNKLSNKGLTAAIASIQPIFTSICELNAPNIKFYSTSDTIQYYTENEILVTADLGKVKIDEHGISIKVATYIFPSSTQSQECPKLECENLQKSFFFGLIFKDTPIFIGNYVDVNKI